MNQIDGTLNGYGNIKRIWEHEVKTDFHHVVNEIADYIDSIKNSSD